MFQRGYKQTKEHKQKISNALRGRKSPLRGRKRPPFSKQWREKISKAKKGKKLRPMTEQEKRALSKINQGENGSNWQGGITPKNKKIRKGIEWRLWREAVYARDGWTCQKCKEKGPILHPHHIYNFAKYKKLRFAIDNGISLCEKCHIRFHKLFGKTKNNKTQINKFLLNKGHV